MDGTEREVSLPAPKVFVGVMRAPGQVARETELEGQPSGQNGSRHFEQSPVHQRLAVRKPDPAKMAKIKKTKETSTDSGLGWMAVLLHLRLASDGLPSRKN